MKMIALSLFALALSHAAMAADSLITKPARQSVAATVDRLEALAKEKGMTIFARVDHAAGAEKVGLKMPPSQVLIFGNPKGGTPLMLASPGAALDLPLKMAVWEDSQGKVWLSYNSMNFIKDRHSITGKDELLKNLNNVLDGLANKTVE